jgi:hypothetical protein
MLVKPVPHVCFLADLGPAFIGWAATIEGTVTCIVSPRAQDDEAVKNQAIELLHRAGAPCVGCDTCPIGLCLRSA